MGKPKAKVIKDNAERWLLTYADLMNLLLIFFIILYAMSNVDQKKYEQLAQSLSEAFGNTRAAALIGEGGANISLINIKNPSPSSVVPSKLEDQQMEEVKKNVESLIKKEGLTGNVEVALVDRGVEISITEKILFESGSASLTPTSASIVERLGKEVLAAIPGKHIRVEGHSDNDPINTAQFPSNWELAGIRAINVTKLLVSKSGLDPAKISSVSYSEYVPKVPNDSIAHKAENRRVTIVILRDSFDKSEAGVSEPIPSTTSGSAASGNTSNTNTAAPTAKTTPTPAPKATPTPSPKPAAGH